MQAVREYQLAAGRQVVYQAIDGLSTEQELVPVAVSERVAARLSPMISVTRGGNIALP